MKQILPLLLLLFLSTSVQAADRKITSDAAGTVKTQQNTDNREEGKKTEPETSREKSWPRTFVPTERINADTVVSFPADI